MSQPYETNVFRENEIKKQVKATSITMYPKQVMKPDNH